MSVLSITVLTFLHVFQHLCGNMFKNNDEDVMWCDNSSAVYRRRYWLCEQGRNKPSIFIWKRGICGKIDYMQYDNAVLPVLREEPGWCSWYSCWLQAEWSGDWIPLSALHYLYQSRLALGPIQLSVLWVQGLFPRVKATRAWSEPPDVHLMLWLEWSNTSAPPPCLHDLDRENLTF